MKSKKTKGHNGIISDETFEMDAEEIRRLGYHAVDIMVEYFQGMRSTPIIPEKTINGLRKCLDETIPRNGQDPHQVLNECQQKIVNQAFRMGHPRLLGWTLPSGTIIGAFADGIAGALNQNVAVSGSGIATALERLVIEWITNLIGYGPNAIGTLVSGGSMANLTGLVTARNIKANYDIRTEGVRQNPRDNNLVIYASAEVHGCILKAADVLGIGTNNINWVRVDENFRLDPHDLQNKIVVDKRNGKQPFAVVATAGTVNTGAIDPLESIGNICHEHDVWFHVDAAYGGFAMLSPKLKPLLKGIECADSIALDPHKWLFIPYEAGCVLVKNQAHLKQTFTMRSSYIHLHSNQSHKKDDVDFYEYGLQLSRQFRALKVWMSLKHHGVAKYGRMIEQNVRLTRYLVSLIDASSDFNVIATSDLSTLCFRYVPSHFQKTYGEQRLVPEEKKESYLNSLNQAIVEMMLSDRRALLSTTAIKNKLVLRVCIMNYRTTKEDIEEMMEIIRECGSAIDIKLRIEY